ncbi:13707_t:CDS:1, partial [Funneliformis mosseae]
MSMSYCSPIDCNTQIKSFSNISDPLSDVNKEKSSLMIGIE